MTIALDTVDCSTFTPLLGHDFLTTTVAGARVALQLSAAQILGHQRPDASREPFALGLRGPTGLRLPQGTYHFACAALGEIEFFITQVADGAQGSEFEAIFT